jgi:programmed cell death 8 (apoptosis-inducing factor)
MFFAVEINQRKYNMHLLTGIITCGGTMLMFYNTIYFNTTPDYRKVKYSTITPKIDDSPVTSAVIESIDEIEDDTPAAAVETIEEAEVSEPVVEESEPVKESVPEPVKEEEPVKNELVEESDAAAKPPVSEPEPPVSEPEPAAAVVEAPTKILEPLPESVPYLLVGAGTASFAACRAIKSRDPTAKILIIGEEERPPYMRPPLSKELWFVNDDQAKKDLKFKQWNGKERSLLYEPMPFYTPVKELEESKNGGISVATGRKVVKIDTVNQIAHLEDGATVKYDKCLLAIGGQPKAPRFLKNGPDDVKEKITLFRNVNDFHKLDGIISSSKSVTILGGGFLGSELACAFGQRSKLGEIEVYQAYQENGNMAKVLPEYLSEWTTSKVQSEGVKTLPNSSIKSIKKNENGRLELDLSNKTVETDHVVVAYGIVPDNTLAKASGIDVDDAHGGFVVNEQFEACPNLWIAGDAASFLDPQLGRRRVEHHDHAIVSGRLAGENMTGADKAYTHQSMFWSDLGPDVGYEAIGIVDSKLPTVGVFAKATETDTPRAVVTESDEHDRSKFEETATIKAVTPQTPSGNEDNQDYGKGIIFYLKEDKIVGMVLWNVFQRMNIARRVLKEGKSYDDLTEVAKLFNIHASE